MTEATDELVPAENPDQPAAVVDPTLPESVQPDLATAAASVAAVDAVDQSAAEDQRQREVEAFQAAGLDPYPAAPPEAENPAPEPVEATPPSLTEAQSVGDLQPPSSPSPAPEESLPTPESFDPPTVEPVAKPRPGEVPTVALGDLYRCINVQHWVFSNCPPFIADTRLFNSVDQLIKCPNCGSTTVVREEFNPAQATNT